MTTWENWKSKYWFLNSLFLEIFFLLTCKIYWSFNSFFESCKLRVLFEKQILSMLKINICVEAVIKKKQNEASLQSRPTTLPVRVLYFSLKNMILRELLVWCLPFLISLFLPDQWLCNMPHWPITNILTLAGVNNTSIVPLMCTKSARSHSILQLWQPRIPQNGIRQVFLRDIFKTIKSEWPRILVQDHDARLS